MNSIFFTDILQPRQKQPAPATPAHDSGSTRNRRLAAPRRPRCRERKDRARAGFGPSFAWGSPGQAPFSMCVSLYTCVERFGEKLRFTQPFHKSLTCLKLINGQRTSLSRDFAWDKVNVCLAGLQKLWCSQA